METTINDTLNDSVYKMKHIEIDKSFDRGLYGAWYFTVNMVYRDDDNMSGQSVEIARFFFKSENPDIPSSFEGTPITNQEAYDSAIGFAFEYAKKYGLDVEIANVRVPCAVLSSIITNQS